MLYGSATYLYRAVKFDLAGQSLFMGSSLEFGGNVWDASSQMSFGKTRKSLSLFVGFNSFMGPIHAGFCSGPEWREEFVLPSWAAIGSIFYELEGKLIQL